MLDAIGIGKRITAARESAGFSKAAVERVLPISRQTLTAWEKGDTSPGINDLSSLCSVFGCDFGYIIGEYGERTRPVTDIKAETGLSPEAIEVLRALNQNCHKDVLQLISDMIVFTVNNPAYSEYDTIIFQALSNVLHLFKIGLFNEAEKKGYLWMMQDLFMDFIKDQLKGNSLKQKK